MRVFTHWLRPATLVLTAMLAAGGCAHEHAASPMAAAPDACAVAARAHEDALMRLPFEIVNGRVYLQAQANDRGPYTFAHADVQRGHRTG